MQFIDWFDERYPKTLPYLRAKVAQQETYFDWEETYERLKKRAASL